MLGALETTYQASSLHTDVGSDSAWIASPGPSALIGRSCEGLDSPKILDLDSPPEWSLKHTLLSLASHILNHD